MVDFGTPIEIFGLPVRTGDLLYADCHGVLSVPPEIAAQIPAVAARLAAKERVIIDFCRSLEFSLETLQEKVKGFRSGGNK